MLGRDVPVTANGDGERSPGRRDAEQMNAVTIYGVIVLLFMMTMYAMERRHPRYVAGFALGCALSSSYGFLSGAWPFGLVEAIWCGIAARRYVSEIRRNDPAS
jgi:hypothetical protein